MFLLPIGVQKMDESQVQEIVAQVVKNFRTFGGGKGSSWGNPIAEALKDRRPSFAGDVDVESVVRFVLDAASVEVRK